MKVTKSHKSPWVQSPSVSIIYIIALSPWVQCPSVSNIYHCAITLGPMPECIKYILLCYHPGSNARVSQSYIIVLSPWVQCPSVSMNPCAEARHEPEPAGHGNCVWATCHWLRWVPFNIGCSIFIDMRYSIHCV